MQTCRNTSLSLTFSFHFLVSTTVSAKLHLLCRGFVIFVQFKPARCSTFVSCPIVLSTYISTSHCLKQFCESVKVFVFSPHVLFCFFFHRTCCFFTARVVDFS